MSNSIAKGRNNCIHLFFCAKGFPRLVTIPDINAKKEKNHFEYSQCCNKEQEDILQE